VDTTVMDAGFHTIALHPAFDAQLGSIDFTYPSPYGEIHSAWTVKDGAAHWQLTVPANATGWLSLSEAEAAKYKLDGQALAGSSTVKASTQMGQAGYELPAGSYRFEVSGIR